ncbi:hypothetical protein BDY19DRAFT_978288, partial [Irpex rosettiformis]
SIVNVTKAVQVPVAISAIFVAFSIRLGNLRIGHHHYPVHVNLEPAVSHDSMLTSNEENWRFS